MEEKALSADVQKLVDRKLDLVRQIRELKLESAKVSLELARTGSRDLSVIALVPRW